MVQKEDEQAFRPMGHGSKGRSLSSGAKNARSTDSYLIYALSKKCSLFLSAFCWQIRFRLRANEACSWLSYRLITHSFAKNDRHFSSLWYAEWWWRVSSCLFHMHHSSCDGPRRREKKHKKPPRKPGSAFSRTTGQIRYFVPLLPILRLPI